MAILDGIPPLLNGINKFVSVGRNIQVLGSAIRSFILGDDRLWDITLNGKTAIDFDGMTAYYMQPSAVVPVHAVEKGGFSAFNKIRNPPVIQVQIVKSGTQEARSQMIYKLDSMIADLNLYTIVTPERVFTDYNLTGYSIQRRSTQGAGMIVADLLFQGIQFNAGLVISEKPKTPASGSTLDAGRKVAQ